MGCTMSELLPTPASGGRSAVAPARPWPPVATRRAERGLERYALRQTVAVEKARIDTRAVAAVVTTSMEEEFLTYDYGMFLANGSAAKQELLARKLEMLSQLNNQLILRRFGR